MPDTAVSPLPVPDLWHLVYASAEAPGFELTDLQDILRASRDHNARLGITGLLLFVEGSFLQVLEGDAVAVDQMLVRIRADARHTRVVLLLREPIENRAFREWTMGYTRVALGELQDSLGANDLLPSRDAFSELGDVTVRKLLELFDSGSYPAANRLTYRDRGLTVPDS